VTGPVALHGGAEFVAGDAPFLRALLEIGQRLAGDQPVRVVVVPAASAQNHPEAKGRHGVEAFTRTASDARIDATATVALVVDEASAADPTTVASLRAAHVIHLPGGDPAVVPLILRGSPAWQAILDANAHGAIVAGASAGAMALSNVTWTPAGFVEGLGLVEGIIVVPHFELFDPRGREDDIDRVARDGLTPLGLDERTGVIREAPGAWRVVGAGRAHWLPLGGEPVIGRHGDILPIAG
jgi:cyanophycinase-like exopeptidase